jgi:AraC family transcriptional regulator of arabinose operon
MSVAYRVESLHPVVHRVLGGHFREGPDYRTWREAGTDDFLLIHTLAGSGRFALASGDDRVEVLVGCGDAVLLRPGAQHDYGTVPGADGWDLVFAHFHPRAEWMSLLEWPSPPGVPSASGLGLIHADDELHRRIGSALRRSARAGRGSLARAELFALNALEESLLWLDTQNVLTARTDERVLRVIEYIGAHLGEALDVERLADLAHLSPSRLGHLFSEHLGISPQRYVERERMMVAEQLLGLTDRPVGAIALEVGWADPLYFSQRFRRFTGSSPSEYRRRARRAAV